jgi:hypothetical protein
MGGSPREGTMMRTARLAGVAGAAALGALAFGATPAGAAIVAIANSGGTIDCVCTLLPPAMDEGQNVNATMQIETFFPDDPNSTNPFGGSSAAAEAWYTEKLAGLPVGTFGGGVQVDSPDGGGKTGSFGLPNVPYFVFKYDGWWAFFRNDNGAQTISWNLPFGLSHITLVPLPGALGLLLTGLGALYGLRRWRDAGDKPAQAA